MHRNGTVCTNFVENFPRKNPINLVEFHQVVTEKMSFKIVIIIFFFFFFFFFFLLWHLFCAVEWSDLSNFGRGPSKEQSYQVLLKSTK